MSTMRWKSPTRKALWICAVVLMVILAWAPWILAEYAERKAQSSVNFIEQHTQVVYNPDGTVAEHVTPDMVEVHVFWFPFGKAVTTYEGLWFVTFWGAVLPP